MKIFLVGGAVRDKLLGIQSKDLDYVMVLDNIDISVEEGFKIMEQYMTDEGFKIHTTHPDMFTIRAKFPKGHKNEKQDADFVLARKEVGYEAGTRRPILELGTLYDDLSRRDLTMNAMAEDENGNIIDFFGGYSDLQNKILRTPLAPNITLLDDPLRLLRICRFSITKDCKIYNETIKAMDNPEVLDKLRNVVSSERIREELLKMFKHDTLKTLDMLISLDRSYCKGILEVCFGGDMWLEPTFKAK